MTKKEKTKLKEEILQLNSEYFSLDEKGNEIEKLIKEKLCILFPNESEKIGFLYKRDKILSVYYYYEKGTDSVCIPLESFLNGKRVYCVGEELSDKTIDVLPDGYEPDGVTFCLDNDDVDKEEYENNTNEFDVVDYLENYEVPESSMPSFEKKEPSTAVMSVAEIVGTEEQYKKLLSYVKNLDPSWFVLYGGVSFWYDTFEFCIKSKTVHDCFEVKKCLENDGFNVRALWEAFGVHRSSPVSKKTNYYLVRVSVNSDFFNFDEQHESFYSLKTYKKNRRVYKKFSTAFFITLGFLGLCIAVPYLFIHKKNVVSSFNEKEKLDVPAYAYISEIYAFKKKVYDLSFETKYGIKTFFNAEYKIEKGKVYVTSYDKEEIPIQYDVFLCSDVISISERVVNNEVLENE